MKYIITIIFFSFSFFVYYQTDKALIRIDNTLSFLEKYIEEIEKISEDKALQKVEEMKKKKEIKIIGEYKPDEFKYIEKIDLYLPTSDFCGDDGKFYLHIPPAGNFLVDEVGLFTEGNNFNF